MTAFEMVMQAENADCDLDKISLMAADIMHTTSDTADTQENIYALWANRESLNLYASMILDYVEKAQETLRKIIDGRKGKN